MAAPARELTLQIQAAVQKRWPSTVRLWPTPNWPLTLPDGRRVNPPRKGISDLMGLVAPTGRLLAIEVKAGKDRLSDEQEQFLSIVVLFGGIGMVGRSAEQVVGELEVLIGGAR